MTSNRYTVVRDERGKVVEDDSAYELKWLKEIKTGTYEIEEWWGSEKVQVRTIKVEVA